MRLHTSGHGTPPPPTSLFITEETKANGIGEGGVRQEGPERGGDGGKEGRREGVEMEGREGVEIEGRRGEGREWRWREGRTEGGSGV